MPCPLQLLRALDHAVPLPCPAHPGPRQALPILPTRLGPIMPRTLSPATPVRLALPQWGPWSSGTEPEAQQTRRTSSRWPRRGILSAFPVPPSTLSPTLAKAPHLPSPGPRQPLRQINVPIVADSQMRTPRRPLPMATHPQPTREQPSPSGDTAMRSRQLPHQEASVSSLIGSWCSGPSVSLLKPCEEAGTPISPDG